MRYEIRFDEKACKGGAICTAIVPWNFITDDGGKIVIENYEIDESQLNDHMEAVRLCPYNALSLWEKRD
jgi:ferredoxin